MSDIWLFAPRRDVRDAVRTIEDVSGTHNRQVPDLVALQSGLPLTFVDGQPGPAPADARRRSILITKRLVDLTLSGLALLVLAPILLLVALMVKLTSPGPVLFRQQRVGIDGRSFELLKFRSMRAEHCDVSGLSVVECGDVRFTPIGEMLRRSSIDELPQLLNVLWGEMSLVGPRPHVAGQLAAGLPYAELVPYYAQRLQVLPGLTGWAQANGLRGSTAEAGPARARIDHDIAYIQNLSLLLDVRVMAQTVWRELFH